MKTCERCGLVNPDTSARCECGGRLLEGDVPVTSRMGTVAGFWIRVAADLVDALFLGVVGMVIAFAFEGPLLRLGDSAVFIGLPLSLLYTALPQSQLGGGRTLAKRLLGLRVLRMDGKPMSIDRSIVRWALISFVFYGGALLVALRTGFPFLNTEATAAAIAGAQLALFLGCAVLVPFHPLKRGLHDLLAGSIVVRQGMPSSEVLQRGNNRRRDRTLVAAAIGLTLIVTILGRVASSGTAPAATGPKVDLLQGLATAGVRNPSVNETFIAGSGGKRHLLTVGGYLPTSDAAAIADAHAKIASVVKTTTALGQYDAVNTVVRTGINIGIYKSNAQSFQ